jgi:hypothetical protein
MGLQDVQQPEQHYDQDDHHQDGDNSADVSPHVYRPLVLQRHDLNNLLVCFYIAPHYTHCRLIETKYLKKSKRKGGAPKGAARKSPS